MTVKQPRKKKPVAKDHRIVRFFGEHLRHTKGEWSGSEFVLAEWQRQFLNELFGTVRKDNLRQYRTAYLEVPRKNGKSTLAAGIALFLLCLDREEGAEIYSAASDKDQASIVFDQACQMIEENPSLGSQLRIYRNKTIEHKNSNSFYRSLSSDAFTKHGLNAHGVIFDEVHAQPNRELWDVLTTSTGARRQPMTLALTTAGHDRQSLCWELRQYAEGVNDKLIHDPTFYSRIYTSTGDWKSESTWKEANPNYGVTVKKDYFEKAVAEASANPSRENAFRRLHLNQWTSQETRWISLERWDACSRDFPDLSGRMAFGGLDLSSTLDLTAFVLLFPPVEPNEPYWILPTFFAPADAARERERNNKHRLDDWERQGLIITTPGRSLDYRAVTAVIESMAQKYNIQEIAVDRWNINQISKDLETLGKNNGRPDWLVGFGQGFAAMTAPSKELEVLVLSEKIAHDGNPVLRWMFSNVQVERDNAGNIKMHKGRAVEKIDGIVATIMALGRAQVSSLSATNIYDTQGITLL